MKKYYNIHDILTMKIVCQSGSLKRFLSRVEREYRFFEREEATIPDLVVCLDGKSENLAYDQGYYFVAGGYIIKRDYLHCRDSYKKAKWELKMDGFEGKGTTTINISSNLFGSMFVTKYVIDRIIHFKLCEKGYSLLHGCCVSKDGQALLFAGRSGAGKTLTALYLIEKGFNFLGDDYVILHEGNVMCFPAPLNIFWYNLTPLVKRKVKIRTKAALLLTYLLYKVSFAYAKILIPISIDDLFAKDVVINNSVLNSVFLIIPRMETSKVNIKRIMRDDLVRCLVASEKLEAFPFFKYMSEYSYVFPDSNMASYWKRYEEHLKKNLGRNISSYRIEIPRRYDMRAFEDVLNTLKSV